MAINVNKVYSTVLSILNKEQRGYITPYEFDQLAAQVQLEIFEKYFEDLNQQVRTLQTDVDYSDRVFSTDEKLETFRESSFIAQSNPIATLNYDYDVPTNLYRLGSVARSETQYSAVTAAGVTTPVITVSTSPINAELVDRSEFTMMQNSNLTQPSQQFPVYMYEGNKIKIQPGFPATPIGGTNPENLQVNYIRRPKDPRWGYYIGDLGQYLYDDASYDPSLINQYSNLFPSLTQQPSPTGSLGANVFYNLPTTTNGNGINLTLDVYFDNSNIVNKVVANNVGSDYQPGDEIIIDETEFPTAIQDLEMTLQSQDFNFDSTGGSINFELHYSETTELIVNILLYAGVVIRDPSIIQVASQQLVQQENNEKR